VLVGFTQLACENYRERVVGMAYVINEPCIGVKDGSCVEACPVDAITPEDMVPSEWQPFIELNAAYYRRQRA
jgi:ferredoxin